MTITHDALDLTVHPPPSGPPWFPSGHGTWGPFPLLVTSGDHHWSPIQNCSLDLAVQFPLPVLTSGGHQRTYRWQVGGMYSTGILSCKN